MIWTSVGKPGGRDQSGGDPESSDDPAELRVPAGQLLRGGRERLFGKQGTGQSLHGSTLAQAPGRAFRPAALPGRCALGRGGPATSAAGSAGEA